MTHDLETRAYVERRRAEGRTTKEIRRSLKRYLARQLYRNLESLHATQDIGPQALDRHRRVHRAHTALGGLPPASRVANLSRQTQ